MIFIIIVITSVPPCLSDNFPLIHIKYIMYTYYFLYFGCVQKRYERFSIIYNNKNLYFVNDRFCHILVLHLVNPGKHPIFLRILLF